ncbi:MAG TPA: LptE family protein [candidate division Zixibacteria bacterium]|nr:LptE family protein [candidate division Zixibacteria bacterium]MDD4916717.1 LptE family protein [candidate division Zixibacteria bacterium]MDM7972581.1 LptE family protein [candidate division Zixibacteria bacterium]HOD67512.1 LptE family protein [candidate division Zixibacteria bacterium]HPI31712.1 LptE family protein [candidate division Zixibacteria bacterium]
MHRQAYRSVAAALFLTGLGLSCGVYTFNPAGKSSIKTIAVSRFENQTVELALTDQITDGVIDAFIADGTLAVAPEDAADAVLAGTLVSYTRAPYQYTSGDAVQSYRVTMDFDIALVNPKDNSEIWKERMSQIGIYDPATETEEDAQRKAIQNLVQAILNRTTKSW